MHLQADVCGALIGSFLAFFLTPNPALHNNLNWKLNYVFFYVYGLSFYLLAYLQYNPTAYDSNKHPSQP